MPNADSVTESVLEVGPTGGLAEEKLRSAGRRILAVERQMAPELAQDAVTEMADIEEGLNKQIQRSRGHGMDVLPQSEFELWEDDFKRNWDEHEVQLRIAHDGSVKAEDMARVENPLILTAQKDLDNTVEVYAGHYYQERVNALLAVVRESPDGDAMVRSALKDFAGNVVKHLEYKYTIVRGMDDAEALRHYKNRERAHNSAILSLNRLNSLAEQYGVRRFTARDFWTSEGDQSNPYVHQRMSCDRNLLEDYATIAFKEEYRRAHKKWEEERKLF